MELWEDPEQIEQAIKTKLWEKYSEKQLAFSLYGYISKYHDCYDKIFHKEMQKLYPDWFITQHDKAAEKKKILLQIAKNGEKRPDRLHPLSVVLQNYTSINQSSYDYIFTEQIQKLRPDWFICSRIENKKQQILQIAKSGKEKITPSHFLWNCFRSYITKKASSYDKVFVKKLSNLRPDWFEDTVKCNKEKILQMAKDGNMRPNRTTKLGVVLNSYLNIAHICYDKVFVKKLSNLRPDWFEHTYNINKQKLLKIAKQNGKRPNSRCKLGAALFRYINKNRCYDKVFDEQLRKLRPDWYENHLTKANQIKVNLLQLAKKGVAKPKLSTTLGKKLNRYINEKENCYDAEFKEQLRKLRPDWFIDGRILRWKI